MINVLNEPLGKTQYYAIRVEFQVRGSPNIHSFIWILNTPKLTLILKVIENGLIFNQFSTITKQFQTCVFICQNLKMSV